MNLPKFKIIEKPTEDGVEQIKIFRHSRKYAALKKGAFGQSAGQKRNKARNI